MEVQELENQAGRQPDPTVRAIRFTGNDHISSIVLREWIATNTPSLRERLLRKFGAYGLDEEELQKDCIRLERLYRRRGFPYAQVWYTLDIQKKGKRVDVLFNIREGEPQIVRRTDITIDAPPGVREEIENDASFRRLLTGHPMAEGKRYQSIFTADVTGAFRSFLEERGFPWPEVEVTAKILEHVSKEGDDKESGREALSEAMSEGDDKESGREAMSEAVSVTVLLRPGPKASIDTFEITGQEAAKPWYILRQTGLHQGDLFQASTLQEAQRQLYAHPLIRFATITLPEQPKDSTLHLRVRLREHALRTVSAAAGIGNEDLLRGEIRWTHRNVADRGHRLSISARASFIEQVFATDYLIPYVFNNKSRFASSPYVERKLEPSYDLFSTGWTNRLIYQINRRSTASFSYEFSLNEELSKKPTVELPESEIDYNISSFVFSAFYSEGFRRSPSGWVISPTFEISGLFGESTYTFQKITADVRHFLPLTSAATLAARVWTGLITGSSSTALPSNILYFAGGTNSVRGWSRQFLGPKQPLFDENGFFDRYLPVGGKAAFTFNLEWRQQLRTRYKGFGFALFIDGGQIWPSFARVDERPVQFSAGGGLRYQSPIGPVRVDVGYKLNPKSEDMNQFPETNALSGAGRFGVHFSIGQAF